MKTATPKGTDGRSATGRVIRGSSRDAGLEIKLMNFERFIEQTRYDPSMSSKLQQDWKDSMMQQLEVQSLKYQYASVYGELVREWLSTEKAMPASMDDDSEM